MYLEPVTVVVVVAVVVIVGVVVVDVVIVGVVVGIDVSVAEFVVVTVVVVSRVGESLNTFELKIVLFSLNSAWQRMLLSDSATAFRPTGRGSAPVQW